MKCPLVHRQSVLTSYDRLDPEAYSIDVGKRPNAVVTPRSPLTMKRAVTHIAHWFCEEGGYDNAGYHEKVEDEHRAYLWTAELFDSQTWDHLAVGACVCWRLDDGEWILGWVWLHPFARNKGMLTEAWPYFRERHGRFLIQHPLSTAMCRFLIKHKYTSENCDYRELQTAECNALCGPWRNP